MAKVPGRANGVGSPEGSTASVTAGEYRNCLSCLAVLCRATSLTFHMPQQEGRWEIPPRGHGGTFSHALLPLAQHRQLWLAPALLRRGRMSRHCQHGTGRMVEAAAATASPSLGIKAGARELEKKAPVEVGRENNEAGLAQDPHCLLQL